jgi:hypothetical protein
MTDNDKSAAAAPGVHSDSLLEVFAAAGSAEAMTGDAILALLLEASQQDAMVSARSELPIEIAFGSDSLDDVIVDAIAADGLDALVGSRSASEVAIGAGTATTSNEETPASTHAHLSIKILFGDDDQGTDQTV